MTGKRRSSLIIHVVLVLAGVIWVVYGLIMQQFNPSVFFRLVDYKEVEKINIEGQLIQNGYSYKFKLPNHINDGDSVVYYTAHRNLSVFIDGQEIYALVGRSAGPIKTSGYVWNYINLNRQYADKEIEFVVESIGHSTRPSDEFYIGPESHITNVIIAENAPKAFVGLVVILLGFGMLVYWYVVGIDAINDVNVRLSYFASFTLFLGVWSICESRLVELLTSLNIFTVIIDHGALMMMPLCFILYTKEIFISIKPAVWKSFCVFAGIVIIIRSTLQVMSLVEIRDSLWMTSLTILCMLVLSIYMIVNEALHGKKDKEIYVYSGCLIALMMATAAEMIIYYLSNRIILVGTTGFLLYVAFNVFVNMRSTNQMILQYKENEVYRKMAMMDALTGLGNRLAFQQEFVDRTTIEDEQVQVRPTTIYMMDLNSLKRCNDNWGHDYGDWYIKTAAEAISESFGDRAKCYRIGGDEFCAVMDQIDDTEQIFISNSLKVLFAQKVAENADELSISVGVASFDATKDKRLHDTLKRADHMMYTEKRAHKAAAGLL